MIYEKREVRVIDLRGSTVATEAPLNSRSLSPDFLALVEKIKGVYESEMKRLDSLHEDKTPRGYLEMRVEMKDRK